MTLTSRLRYNAGKGKKQIDDKGNFKGKETFVHVNEIGIWKDKQGNYCKTNRGTIHYSNTGAHIVPSMPINLLFEEESQ